MSFATVSDTPLRPDEKPLAEYRSVSKLAITAALFGAASILVLVHMLLLPVALAAVVLSVLALRSIAASEGQLVGRTAALVGLALAMLFAGWGFSRYVTRQTQLEIHGRQLAEEWLALMADGQYRQAYQLERPSSARLYAPEALEHMFDANREEREMFEGRLSSPPISDFIAEGSEVRYRYVGLASTMRHSPSDYVALHYVIERPAERGGDRPMYISVQRAADYRTGRPEWLISSVVAEPRQ